MGTSTKTFYLDPPQLIGRPNSDGTVTLTPLELKKLNDYNYAVAKMLQGNLNLANLNTETNEVFTDMEGNITAISATAEGLTVDVSNLDGDVTTLQQTTTSLSSTVSNLSGSVSSVTQTVNGLGIETISGETWIGGSNVAVNSSGVGTALVAGQAWVGSTATNGTTVMPQGIFCYDGSKVYLYSFSGVPLKLKSGSSMSIESDGTLYINTAAGNGGVTIGQAGKTISLVGNVYINGVLQ